MLADQRILVTGANGGIGISICEMLLQNNAKLVLFYHDKRNEIDKLLSKYENFRTRIEIHQVNLLDHTKLGNTLNTVLNKVSVDSFIHSVTLPIENKSIEEMKWEDYQSHIEMQTRSFLQIVQSLVPSMKERKHGKIINILTAYTVSSPPNRISHYIVGKYSLLGLSKALAVELGTYGISVNCVSPSMVNTPLIEKLPSKLKEITAGQIPMKRLAEPVDVASTALFLCSKYSDFITGENILVTGGQFMH